MKLNFKGRTWRCPVNHRCFNQLAGFNHFFTLRGEFLELLVDLAGNRKARATNPNVITALFAFAVSGEVTKNQCSGTSIYLHTLVTLTFDSPSLTARPRQSRVRFDGSFLWRPGRTVLPNRVSLFNMSEPDIRRLDILRWAFLEMDNPLVGLAATESRRTCAQ